MKNSIFLLCCVFPLLANAQIRENFDPTTYPHNRQWQGHPFAFGINANSQLQSQTINTTYISTENRLAQGAIWEVGIKLAFNPSPANQLRIYLLADNDTLTAPLNGYFIQIGENGSADRYHLFRQNGDNTELLLSSQPLERADPTVIRDRIRVIRDIEGDWELQLAIDGGEFITTGTATDMTFMHTAFFGFYCRFTSANSDKFHFDYFSIDTTTVDIVPDIVPTEHKLLPDNTDSVLFYDDFSAGFPSIWLGDTAAFEPVNDRLRLKENEVSPAFVTVPGSRINNTVWEAGIQVDGNLSTGTNGNNVRLYLASTTDTLNNPHYGYHLQIDGSSGNHVYRLWRQNGGTRSQIFQSDPIPNQDGIFRARVRVVRDNDAHWRIFADEYDSGVFEPVLHNNGDSSVVDDTYTTTRYTGFFTSFTKTRWSDYAFDYLLIKPVDAMADSVPDTDSGAPAQPHDIIINEIMARPNGVAGLPEHEYLELYNPTNEPIDLAGWKYESLTTSHTFTSGRVPSNGYLILCRVQDTPAFVSYGETLGISPWPGLVDNGTTLTLKNQYGTIIDEVSYHPSWYHDSQKRRGGWSLERINPRELCLETENWMASTDSRGGTPGGQNSVYDPDHATNFTIIDFAVQSHDQILLTFSRSLDLASAASTEKYRLNNGVGQPTRVEPVDSRSIMLHYENPLPMGLEYAITIAGLTDCAGQSGDFQHVFFIPHEIQPNDILINEILFNPKSKGMDQVTTDGVDFVEIYNHSSRIVDLQQLYLAHVNSRGVVAGHRQISESPLLLYPAEYKVLTSAPAIVKEHYPLADQYTFIHMASLPPFNNDSGTALLISRGMTIDSLTYHAAMHAPFITNRKGISLERIRFDIPTNAAGSFHSAATSVGGATPGYRNSQGAAETAESAIYLTSKTFSPDGDGFEDLLEINYHFPASGNMANVQVFNDRGELVRRLQSNQSMALRGTITWDGRSDTNQRLPVGIYIVLIEIYNAQGFRKVYRTSFALVEKM